MYHNFFLHSSVNGHLDCIHVLVVVNNAVMNIGVHVSFSIKGHIMKLEKEMATYSNILAWRILWTEKLGRLQSIPSQRVVHD